MSKVEKTSDEWREQLTAEQYRVTREGGTEPAFSGAYWDTTDAGSYRCVCCHEPLFSSETKFDAGCGWPSFFEALDTEKVRLLNDDSHGMRRVEVRCRNCESHLGHVFDDGPAPTGQRFCINSASISIEKPE